MFPNWLAVVPGCRWIKSVAQKVVDQKHPVVALVASTLLRFPVPCLSANAHKLTGAVQIVNI